MATFEVNQIEDSKIIDPSVYIVKRNNYMNRPDKLYVASENGPPQVLTGLRFDAADIRNIIDQGNVKSLFITFIESPNNPANLSVVASAIINNLANANDVNGIFDLSMKLYEYCEPCPSRCPLEVG